MVVLIATSSCKFSLLGSLHHILFRPYWSSSILSWFSWGRAVVTPISQGVTVLSLTLGMEQRQLLSPSAQRFMQRQWEGLVVDVCITWISCGSQDPQGAPRWLPVGSARVLLACGLLRLMRLWSFPVAVLLNPALEQFTIVRYRSLELQTTCNM